jgi:hypothetical protein
MLEELFRAVSAQALEAATPKIVKPPAEPDHRYLVIQGSTVSRMEAVPHPREHCLGTLASLLEAIKHYENDEGGVVVWYDRTGVTVHLNDETRRDLLQMGLPYAKPLQVLLSLQEKTQPMQQKPFVLLLRTTFATCCSPGVVDLFKKIKFRQGVQQDSVISHGKASLGKSVEMELTGTKDLPEYLSFDVRVWESGFTSTQRVECALEIDAAAETFSLIPLPGQIEGAIQKAMEALGVALAEGLEGVDVPVFCGSP